MRFSCGFGWWYMGFCLFFNTFCCLKQAFRSQPYGLIFYFYIRFGVKDLLSSSKVVILLRKLTGMLTE